MVEERWEHFPHAADIGVRGIGRTKERAFELAAMALTAVITDPGAVRPEQSVAVACAALVEVWAWGKAAPGRYLMIVLVSTYLVLAMISVLYARSSPRQRLRSP